jgi:predicted solute-binding protein
MQTIRVAHSPDSDDAFMYFGIASGAVRGDGIAFERGLLESSRRTRPRATASST